MLIADIAITWLRIGLLGFGGGPAMIPLMKQECVTDRAWMTDAEFLEGLAVGTSLPGPVSAKMSVFVGMKVAGPMGALVAFFAVLAPPGLLMIVASGMLIRYRELPALRGAMGAVKPVVVALLAWTVVELAPDGVQDWRGAAIAGVAMAALLMRVHPALVLVSAMVLGAALLR